MQTAQIHRNIAANCPSPLSVLAAAFLCVKWCTLWNVPETSPNGQSLVYSFFTRYINTISVANQRPPSSDNQSEVFSLPISDKPPSYNSLFKPNANLLAQQNSLAANRAASHQSLSSSVYSSYQTAPELPTGRRTNGVSNARENPAFIVDVNDLPTYESLKSNNWFNQESHSISSEVFRSA